MTSMERIERDVRWRVRGTLGSMVVMTILAGVFILHPEYGRASEARQEIRRLERESGSMVATESRLEQLEKELEHRRSIVRTQLREIPTASADPGLADALELNVDDGGASSWSVRMLDPEPVLDGDDAAGWRCQPAVLEMAGRFETVMDALRRVEESDRLVRVRMLRVARPRGADPAGGVIDATVELDTVFDTEEER